MTNGSLWIRDGFADLVFVRGSSRSFTIGAQMPRNQREARFFLKLGLLFCLGSGGLFLSFRGMPTRFHLEINDATHIPENAGWETSALLASQPDGALWISEQVTLSRGA